MKTILDDPILADLDHFREEYAAAFNNDVEAMMADLIREQEQLEKQGRKFVAFPPQRCQPSFPFSSLKATSEPCR